MTSSNVFLPLVRELVETYQAFEGYSSHHVRSMGLTPCQFDIIATLGNTAGMSFRELGHKTLITKGTLTGVVQRLEEKGLVQCYAAEHDGRSQIIQLTVAGEGVFNDVFPRHLQHMGVVFAALGEDEIRQMQAMLQRLHSLLGGEIK